MARGLYTLPGQDFGENDSLVQLAKLVPDGIICLLSALRVHELTTQNPSVLDWMAKGSTRYLNWSTA